MAIVQKLLLKSISKHFRLSEVLDYVFKPNQNNEDIAEIKNDIKILKALAHPERDFVRCFDCNSKIKENIC